MQSINCPCYECKIRQPSCHSACNDYINWVDKREKQKQAQRTSAEKIINEYYCSKKYRGE